MSLDHSVTKVKDWKQKSIDNYGTREALVWACLLCGVNEITEETAELLAKRIYIYERACGCIRNAGFCSEANAEHNGNGYLSLGDVREWIGMWTNATTFTDEYFCRRMYGYIEDHLNKESSAKISYEMRFGEPWEAQGEEQ